MTDNKLNLPLDGNLDLGYSTNKKRFSVNSDVNTVIEFDPTDIGVAHRLSKALPKFQELSDSWSELSSIVDEVDTDNEDEKFLEDAKKISDKLDKIESETRALIDECFDSKLADTLLGNSSAFSPVNGFFKYEHIINALLNCYTQNVKDEAPKFNKRRVQKHTKKYVK